MDAAVTADSFNFLTLFLRADWVVKVVMVGLALASLWSWTVILDKTFRFASLGRQADRFELAVTSGRSLEEVAQQAGERPRHVLPRMLQAALREWREGRVKSATEGQTAFLVQRIDRVLDAMIARESARVEDGLGVLAIVATASPFVGLFGTVWGIMHAFQNIAIQKNTNLAVVAPAIAEALFATAMGLIAAIPAYIAYNAFSTKAGKFAGRLESFADDLSTAIQRRLSERV
jgi:biopolymer transport protein TolQ